MADVTHVALELARRTKRLRGWREWFANDDCHVESRTKVGPLLDEYRGLLRDLALKNDGSTNKWDDLYAVERQITALFELSRLESRKDKSGFGRELLPD